jgi:SAM-dependent methyltransferase
MTTPARINQATLNRIAAHHRRLALTHRIKTLPYERCAELPWVIDYLAPQFGEPLRYLDVGSGESPLPTFLFLNTQWEITCLDKCNWVRKQREFLDVILKARRQTRFTVIEADLLTHPLPAEFFDVITCISVIEHFEGDSDTRAMLACARLLRPGGTLILTTLINEGYFAEFYKHTTVYGNAYRGTPVFYQRHYDLRSLQNRLIGPSGLNEAERVYFGDYDFQCFENRLQQKTPLRVLHRWKSPALAQRHLSYRTYPVSRKNMRMNTASGVILALTKPHHGG